MDNETIEIQDEFITADEVLKAPRGRKAVVNQALCDLLAGLTPGGGGVRLTKMFGSVSKFGADRSGVSQSIRKHFALVNSTDGCSIDYTPAVYDDAENIISGGVPQVFAVPARSVA